MPLEDEAAALVQANPDLSGPQKVIDAADALREAMVPTHPYEMDYLAGRIAISVEEARLALGVGTGVMKAALASGEIPSVKIQGRRLIPVKALERHLEALAYASSGSLDAWQTALVRGQATRLRQARRRAWERRKRIKKRLANSRAAINAARSDVQKVDVLLALKADLADLEREEAISEKFRRDIEHELEGIETEL